MAALRSVVVGTPQETAVATLRSVVMGMTALGKFVCVNLLS